MKLYTLITKNTSHFTNFSLVSVCTIVDAKRGCETVLNKLVLLPPVVQKLDSAIYRINHYPTDMYYRNQLRHPVDSDLSGG